MALELFMAFSVTLALDRLTKRMVAKWIAPCESIVLAGGVRICLELHTFRRTRSWLSDQALILLLGGIVFAVLLLAGLGFFNRDVARLGLAIAFAGAASNLFDRLRARAVVDFVCIGRWPPFNLADVGIVAGVGLAALHVR